MTPHPARVPRDTWCGPAIEVTIQNEMERSKFEALVAQALDSLPRTFRDKLTNVAIIVEDLPPKEAESEGLLLGLFHGIPRTEEKRVFEQPAGSDFPLPAKYRGCLRR
jgi:predicted Zn-dependent protease with MMP-like domain